MLVKHYILRSSFGKEQKIADKISELTRVEHAYLVPKESGLGSDITLKLVEDITNEQILSIGAYLGQLEASDHF